MTSAKIQMQKNNNNKQSMFHAYVLGHFYAEVIT